MEIEKGKFEIPFGRGPKGKYSSVFMEFASGNEEMMKVRFESSKEAVNCYRSFVEITRRNSEFKRFKVIKRGLDVYVVREG